MIPILTTTILSKIPWKIVGIIAVVVYIFIMTALYVKLKENFQRVSSNQEILLNQITKKLDENKQLLLTPAEFKRTIDSTTQKILEDNNLKEKNIEHLIKATATAGGTVTTVPRDTFIIRKDTLVPATTFVYTDKFVSIKGIQTKEEVTLNWNTWDDLRVLLYWRREGKFIPALFGKKAYRADIKGINPYIKYTVNQNIKVSKE